MAYFRRKPPNMDYINNTLKVLFCATIFLSIIILPGCSDDEEPEPEPPTPWVDIEILPGNFRINTAPITISEDISSIDFYDDGTDYYSNSVVRSRLPSSDFEFYSILIYVPTDLNFFQTTVSGAGGRLYYYDGNSIRIAADDSSSFIETINNGGIEYSVYEIVIRDTDLLANSITFERMVYAFNVIYEDVDTGNRVHSGTVNVEVYADTPSQADQGDITFWVSSDFGCGFIDVTLSSQGTQTISSFFGTNPGCGASGSANFNNLELGTYTFGATSTSGCTWSGSINLDISCYTLELTP